MKVKEENKEKKEKNKKNRIRKSRIFPLLMALYVCLWLVAIVFVADIVWNKAYAYQNNYNRAKEESQPELFMDKLVTEINARKLSQWLSEDGEFQLSAYGNLDEYELYFKQIIGDNKIIYEETDHKNIYDIKAGEEIIAKVKIASDNIYNEYNFTGWKLIDADVLSYMKDTMSKTIVVDKSYKVYVNEKELTVDYRVSESVTSMEAYMSGAMGQAYGIDTYKIEGFLVEPQIYVVDKNGNRVENTSSENDTVEYLKPKSGQMDTIKMKYVVDTFAAYFEHMNKLREYDDMKPLLLEGTNAYSLIEAAQKSLEWVVPVKKITIEEQVINNYVEYASNFFSCDVYMNVLKDYEYTTKNEHFNAEVLFKRVNNKWYLDTFILK